MTAERGIFDYPAHWAECLGPAPELPMSRGQMDALGWDRCDVILVTGDAYVDHPSFGMALVGRLLEAQGFRVGIIAQPDWRDCAAFQALGRPTLYFGVTAGNMDSMVNRYTSERRLRSDDAYTPGGEGGQRPDRAVIVYTQRLKEAFRDVPVVIGGIEASLRRIAHYDYWSDKIRRSVLVDSKADLLFYGNAERALVAFTHRVAAGEPVEAIRDLPGTALLPRAGVDNGWFELDSTSVDTPRLVDPMPDPYARSEDASPPSAPGHVAPTAAAAEPPATATVAPMRFHRRRPGVASRERTVIRLPSFELVKQDPVLYAHASRILHVESNPGNARALVQRHGARDVWVNPPPAPLSTDEMDRIYELPYTRRPHSSYGDARIPAYEMIRFSVTIMRGCFGGCSFCSITEHEGRVIQSRSQDSILREMTIIRDRVPGFTGVVSDLGGPTANMYRMACKSKAIEAACRRPSCVYPGICSNLDTDHAPLIDLYRKARALPGIKKVLIGSGLRYDLAVRSPEYVKELATHHVGGYLKIAPEHSEGPVLEKMMKPGMETYYAFKRLFDMYSKEAGKSQYLIPYFIAAHPGSTNEDMLKLALWLKANDFRLDQVQTFLPSPMALATAMYHSGRNPLRRVKRDGERVYSAKRGRTRRLQKALLRYHDPENWPLLREGLKQMGRADLIGNGKRHLVPAWQPSGTGKAPEGVRRRGRAPPSRVQPKHKPTPTPSHRGGSAGAAPGKARKTR